MRPAHRPVIGVAVAMDYELGRVPRIVSGPDALRALGPAVDGFGTDSAVVIVDEAVKLVGYSGRVMATFRFAPVIEHVVPAGEPTIASVNAAADAVRSMPGAVVIAVGGGSALDTAKQAAVVAAGDTGVEPYLLCANPFVGRRPIIAIPTTSGTGAEVTRTCIVADAEGHKSWTWGDEMLPDLVILDPNAAVTMPAHVTAATGLDAFVHALEASSGQRRNSLSYAPAIEAMRLVHRHLPRAVGHPDDLVARQGMQEAALLAGTAIDNSGTGMAHSIGHALGSLYHVPHGAAVAIGLDAAIEWNVAGAPEAYEAAAIAFNASASDLPAIVRDLFVRSDFARAVARLDDSGADPAAIAEMMVATENQPMFANNSRRASDDDRHVLAELTVESWRRLRSTAGVSS